jgi:acetyl esterase/lipase
LDGIPGDGYRQGRVGTARSAGPLYRRRRPNAIRRSSRDGSRIAVITGVKPTTRAFVGESDAECRAAQSCELSHALKVLGIPTQLVVYPGGGHEFAYPAHRRDRVERTLA